MKVKCYIYKRATLFREQNIPLLLDYTDGTLPHTCEITFQNGVPLYLWQIHDQIIPIPLNVSRNSVTSIVRQGVIPTENGEIHYEFIFGKYRTYTQYYLTQLQQLAPILLVILIIYSIEKYRNNNK